MNGAHIVHTCYLYLSLTCPKISGSIVLAVDELRRHEDDASFQESELKQISKNQK